MSLENALDRNTAAIERLIGLLESASWSNATAATPQEQAPPPTAVVAVTVEQCQAAAARAVERLGNTVEAKTLVKGVITKHGKTLVKDLSPLQLNAVFSELENM